MGRRIGDDTDLLGGSIGGQWQEAKRYVDFDVLVLVTSKFEILRTENRVCVKLISFFLFTSYMIENQKRKSPKDAHREPNSDI